MVKVGISMFVSLLITIAKVVTQGLVISDLFHRSSGRAL